MRQGIVMEKHQRYAIVMTQDGAFQKAKPIPHSMPGDEVEFEPFEEKQWSFAVFPKSLKPSYRMIAMVTALLIAILPLYSWFDSNRAYAYVNIDMNPSIEIKVNNKMKVVEMIPLNDDASLLVEKITDWKNKSVDKVTVTVIEKGEEIGLINDKESVMVGVSYKKQMEKNKRITEMIDQYLQTNPLNLTVATFEVPKELRKQAQKEKKSMNELFAKQYSKDKNTLKTSTNEKKGNDINEEEEKAIQSFYNKEDQGDKEAPDSIKKNEQDNESENGQTTPDQVNEDQEKEKKKEQSSTNPVGKEKGWAKDKNKKEEDQNTDNQQNDDLPSGLEKRDLEELLKSLPPGIQKKLEREGIEDLEELLESLPPGLLKQIETSDLQEIREKLRRLDSDLFSDFNKDQKEDEGESRKEEDRDDEDDREERWNNRNKSKQTPPGQAKKDKKNRNDDRDEEDKKKRGWGNRDEGDRDDWDWNWDDRDEKNRDDREDRKRERDEDDREEQERGNRGWNDRDDARDDRGRENRGRGHGKDKKDRDDED